MDTSQTADQLKRGLKNRHIQLIALGGAVGTGLFLGLRKPSKWPVHRYCWAMRLPELLLFSLCVS